MAATVISQAVLLPLCYSHYALQPPPCNTHLHVHAGCSTTAATAISQAVLAQTAAARLDTVARTSTLQDLEAVLVQAVNTSAAGVATAVAQVCAHACVVCMHVCTHA